MNSNREVIKYNNKLKIKVNSIWVTVSLVLMHGRKLRGKYEAITVHNLKGMGHSLSAFHQAAFFMYFNFEKINISDHPLGKKFLN